jgi:secondary thiamine-phosphate synthase enzyme
MILKIKTSAREEILDITEKVKEAVDKESDSESKACLIYVPHATCAIIINENYDKFVCEDILDFLHKEIPAGKWKHDKIDNNADAHIKASIIGPSQIALIENKKLKLGRWQGIGLAEFDGPRERTVIIKII